MVTPEHGRMGRLYVWLYSINCYYSEKWSHRMAPSLNKLARFSDKNKRSAPVSPAESTELRLWDLESVSSYAPSMELCISFLSVTPVQPSETMSLYGHRWRTDLALILAGRHEKERTQLYSASRLSLQGWHLGEKNIFLLCKYETHAQSSMPFLQASFRAELRGTALEWLLFYLCLALWETEWSCQSSVLSLNSLMSKQ